MCSVPLSALIDIPELMDLLEENYQYWCDLELAESRGQADLLPPPQADIAEESGGDSSPAEEEAAPAPGRQSEPAAG